MNHFKKLNARRYGLLILLATALSGCGPDHPAVVPASGVVLFEGKPLTSGSLMFQPERGRHSRAQIETDGTFVMSTFGEFDGTTVGKHSVRVSSTQESKVDAFGEEVVGKSLIPRAYGNFRTSGITVDIPAEGTDSIVIELTKTKK